MEKYAVSQKDICTVLTSNLSLGNDPKEINQAEKKKPRSIKICSIKD